MTSEDQRFTPAVRSVLAGTAYYDDLPTAQEQAAVRDAWQRGIAAR